MIAEQDAGDEEQTRPEDLEERLAQIRQRGYEVMPSQQTAGVYNLSAPVLGADNTALAALTCPYIAPLNRPKAPDIPKTIAMLQETAAALSLRVRGHVDAEPRCRGSHDFYLNDLFICDYLWSEETSRGPRGAMQTPIIDTHLHLIYRDRLSYPWLADVAPLNRDFSYETYAAEARRCGVTDAIHMEVDVAPDDIEAETREVEDLARRPQSLLRGAISSCRPEDDRLSRLSRPSARQSVRQRLPPRAARRPRRLERRRDVSRQYQAARRSGAAVRPLRAAGPDRQGDRARRPSAPRSSLSSITAACLRSRTAPSIPGARSIAEIARRPNVAVKISGVVAYAEPGGPGPSTTFGPTSSTRSKASAGTGWSGAAIGRSAR